MLKVLLISLLVVGTVYCADNVMSGTLDKLTGILSALNIQDILEGKTAHKLGSHFFKYYSDDLLPLQFKLWKEHTGQAYESDEQHEHRQKVWSDNMMFIHEHNKKNRTYRVEMNHLGDLTHDEYKEKLLGMNIEVKVPLKIVGSEDDPDPDCPFSLDWRNKGYVTAVKNQGQCGSCWSFSTTGGLEGLHMKTTGKLVSLSEQNLMDCSWDYGNNGCGGGLMDYAYEYVVKNGLDSEASYPYEAVDGTCNFNSTNVAIKISGYKDVVVGSEASLKQGLQQGPVSIAIDASQQSFQFYSTGVYNEPDCSSTQLDHGVLTVGYGRQHIVGSKYWIVKNSWGETWGVDGYILMSRDKSNQCGVASAASYPTA